MPDVKFSLIALTLLFLVSRFFAVGTFAEASEGVAALVLADAEGVVASAYQAVLEAEEAGANVSSLLVRLNEAGKFLVQGRDAYKVGDFDDAVLFANSSSSIGAEVKDEANESENLAISENLQRASLSTVESIVGVTLVVLASFLAWNVFKKRYYRWVLGKKPEVCVDES